MEFLSLILAGFSGFGVKISFNLREGISIQGPEIVIFRDSCSTFLFGSFKPGVKIRMNLRDGIFPKRLKRYIASLKLAGFAGFGVTISFTLPGGISTKTKTKLSFSVTHVALSYLILSGLE